MMTVLDCVAGRHNIWLVVVAAILCTVGSLAVIRLFMRAAATTRLQRVGWHVLTAIAGGATIWCTHFVAMIGYDAGVPIRLDPLLTLASLGIAMLGVTMGFVLATTGIPRAPIWGGAVVGLAISAMHYTGMVAYRVEGIVSWDGIYLASSVVFAIIFSAAALQVALRRPFHRSEAGAVALMVVAIVSLHFVGMTAFRVEPLLAGRVADESPTLIPLALSVTGAALLIVAAGLASYLIDDRSRAENYERLRHMALNDALTGMPNRTSFRERLDAELTAADTDTKLAVIGIDLDRFKEVNDFRGHAAGDEVLKILGQRMKSLICKGEYLARLGGDEFAAVYRMHDQEGLYNFLRRLQDALTKPIMLDDYEFHPGASIGVAIYPKDADDAEALLNNADLALYRAKASKAGKPCFYEPTMDEAVRIRRTLAGDLRDAIANDHLEVHYQVQTSVSTGEVKGFEALVRWKHAELGFIAPGEFIPLAEEEGLILKLGEWVLRKACADAASWNSPYNIAVNFSPLQFAHTDLPRLIMEVLLDTGLAPQRLELELTETAIFADRERALHILRQIKSMGVSVALDDFGTGYSSLDTLRSFPFDKIKLDASFIREVEQSAQAKAIIRAVLALGRSLQIPILAEGIETEGQLALLKNEGCDEAQGFLLGRPEGLSDLMKRVQLRLAS